MKDRCRRPHRDKSQCPVAHALDILGDRWTLLVIRELMFMGKHEYKEFLQAPEGISTNILSDRLKKLQCAKVIDSVAHPDFKTRKFYYLTASGKDLIHVMVSLAAWADKNLDSVGLPPEIQRRLRDSPQKMIRDTLRRLDDWENKVLRSTDE